MFVKSKMRLLAATLAAPVVFMAGCGSGSNSTTAIAPPPSNITPLGTPTVTLGGTVTQPAANVQAARGVAVVNGTSLVIFNTRTPSATRAVSLSGLAAGETLLGIDYRFAPAGQGTGLYGLTRTSPNNFQLVRIDFNAGFTAANAVRIGSGFSVPNVTTIGFDFNPQVVTNGVRGDAIRVVSPTGVNFRVNPNTGALVDADPVAPGQQNDGAFTAPGQRTPRLVAVAYDNNDTNINTPTTFFAIDAANNRVVSSNTPNAGGPLVDEGGLGFSVSDENVGFDIINSGNQLTAFATVNNNGVYSLFASDNNNGFFLVGNIGVAPGNVVTGFALSP
jgi:hypothetical protein